MIDDFLRLAGFAFILTGCVAVRSDLSAPCAWREFEGESVEIVRNGRTLPIVVDERPENRWAAWFLADTIEYGQWKLGKRNESVTFSIQPLINKLGGALATALVSIGVVLSGIKTGDVAAEAIDAAGKLVVKGAMFIIPLIFIVVGYIIYRKKFKLDEKRYGEIVAELEARGELVKK